MTPFLIVLILAGAVAAIWWVRRAWRECAACFLQLTEFNYPTLGDDDDH